MVNSLGHLIPIRVLDLLFHNEEAQMRECIDEFVKRSDPVEVVDLPGDTRTHRKPSDNSRNLTKGVIDWIVMLQKFGWSHPVSRSGDQPCRCA